MRAAIQAAEPTSAGAAATCPSMSSPPVRIRFSATLAVGESSVILHPTLPFSRRFNSDGERGCQWNDSLADGWRHRQPPRGRLGRGAPSDDTPVLLFC